MQFKAEDREAAIKICVAAHSSKGFGAVAYSQFGEELGLKPDAPAVHLAIAAWHACNFTPSPGQDAVAAELLRHGWAPPPSWKGDDDPAFRSPCRGCALRKHPCDHR